MNERVTQSCLRYGVTGLAAIGVLTAAACSSSGGGKPSASTTSHSSSSSTSTAPSSPSPSPSGGTAPSDLDLTSTLINPADIPGGTFTLKSADPINQAPAVGVDGEFSNADGSRTVTDVLVWLPTDSDTDTALTAEQAAAAHQITGGLTDAPIEVGVGGHIYSGTTANGPATIIVFQEANYVVTLEFNSKAASDAIPANLATGVATAQDTKVKAAI